MRTGTAWLRTRGQILMAAMVLLVNASAMAASGNYLIIVPEGFAGTAPMTQFAAHKAAQGLDVSTHVVSAGTTNSAIKSFIQSLWETPEAPNYILIVGDTSGSSSTALTIPHWVGGGSKHATTDLPYACMDAGDDWYPDIAIGRFSVSSVDELQAVVDKTICVESGVYSDPDYVKRAAFLASSDTGSGAEPTHDWVIANYMDPAEYESIRVYATQGASTPEITAAVNAGCVFCVYFGHSSSSGWWAPSFGDTDIWNLNNPGLYGLVFGFSCNTAHFDYDECFGETWIRVPDRGAAAYLSASTYIYYGGDQWESSRRLEKYFFESFFVDNLWEVGPAWQKGLYRLLADPDFGSGDVTRNMFEMFVLLGDPALELPNLNGFALEPVPVSQEACAPPDEQVSYSIQVSGQEGFSETVTLSASGEPAGTTVTFDVNGVAPPFTSQMTIDGLASATPGHYDIMVQGTSASLQRGVAVGLDLSTDVPGPVTLVSPADGLTAVARMPTLTWDAASQAIEYDLEIATDAGFGNVVYSVTVARTSHPVNAMLSSVTAYFWHVQAVNACGDGGFSPTFSFTTLDQPDYFTEEFGSGFDLDGLTIHFIPDGSGDYYSVCKTEVTELPVDPSGGTSLVLGDDDYEVVMPSSPVSLYGTPYSNCYVGSNGYMTFTGGDTDWNETLDEHFEMARVSALYDDLTPPNGGPVSWKETAEALVVTYEDVPEYSNTGSNTFQIELLFNGEIRITWLGITAGDGIVGLSAGTGTPPDYQGSDLSASMPCPDYIYGDLDCDGDVDFDDINPFVLALGGEAGYVAAYPDCRWLNADCDEDGDVDFDDINPFVGLLGGGQ